MSDTRIENAICLAINILTNKKIGLAPFDRTIRATVLKTNVDGPDGYRVQGLGASDFTAYSINSDVCYLVDDVVYVLIPGGNMNRKKTIIGGGTDKATNYVDTTSNRNYKLKTQNFVTLCPELIGLHSLLGWEGETRILYDRNKTDNELNVDDNIGIEQLGDPNDYKDLVVAAKFRTNLGQNQVGGNYGLIFTLLFKDNTTSLVIPIDFRLDITDVVFSDPYYLIKPKDVEHMESIMGYGEFKGVEKIVAFCEKFPAGSSEPPVDIFISDIRIQGALAIDPNTVAAYSITINYSLYGTVIRVGDPEREDIPYTILTALFRTKGTKTNYTSTVLASKLNYYWFVLDAFVGSLSEFYSPFGGIGWKCLNKRTTGEGLTGQTKGFTPFKTNKFLFTYSPIETLEEKAIPVVLDYYNRDLAYGLDKKQQRVKCVIVYDNTVRVNDTVTLINKTNYEYDSEIISTDRIFNENKTIYYLGDGSPTLEFRTKINSSDKLINKNQPIEYKWTVTDNRGNLVEILTKKDFNKVDGKEIDLTNTRRNELLQKYNQYELRFKNFQSGDKAYAAAQIKSDLNISDDLFDYILSLLNTEYICLNFIYNVNINRIHLFSTFTCSGQGYVRPIGSPLNLKGTKLFLGTASIELENKMALTDGNQLYMENGTQVFQYDNDGVSPANAEMLEKPLEIKPLTFTWITGLQSVLSAEQVIAAGGSVKWYFPVLDTLLRCLYTNADNIEKDGNFAIIKQEGLIPYTIVNNYDNKLKNNTVKLLVTLKDNLLVTYSDFTFAKDGDPGTNGTKYVAKLTPLNSSTDRLYLMKYTGENNTSILYDDLNNSVEKLIYDLYENSKKLSEGDVTWLVLGAEKTNTNISINNGVITLNNITNLKPFNIVRAKRDYNGFTHYAQYPINVVKIADENDNGMNYRLMIAPKSGFKYAVYTSDGRTPQYDNTLPFEIIIEKRQNGYWLRISNLDGVDFTYSCESLPEESFFMIEAIENEPYKFNITPCDTFDGGTLNTAILFKVLLNGELFAGIHVPIYMSLNRYGNAAINAWDGNSIDLGDTNGNTILAPQVGAGSKDKNDNTFTGVLMGKVEKPVRNDNNEIIDKEYNEGLFGYYKGQQTIFLDAGSGKAEFGVLNEGKIILDPTAEKKGLIYGGNYSESDKTGMLIDLTTPEIKFGSGNFSVDKNGHLVAKGGGEIAGWKISDTALTSPTGNLKLGIEDIEFKNYDNTTAFQVKLGVPVYKKDLQGQDTTEIDHYTSSTATIAGWEFDNEKLSKGQIKISSKDGIIIQSTEGNDENPYFKASTDGTTTIGSWIVKSNQINSGGSDPSIVLQPDGTVFKGKTTIGGWKVDENNLSAKNININSNGSITGNYSAQKKDAEGKITDPGTGWAIRLDGSATFYNINAVRGTIGGSTIANNSIYGIGDCFVLGPSGCHFKGLTVTNNGVNVGGTSSGGSGSYSGGGGGGISGGGGSWTSNGGNYGPYNWGSDGKGNFQPENLTINGVKFDTYVSNLAVGNLWVQDDFYLGTRHVRWTLVKMLDAPGAMYVEINGTRYAVHLTDAAYKMKILNAV